MVHSGIIDTAMTSFTLRIDDELVKHIDNLARITGMSRNAYIEDILRNVSRFENLAIGVIEVSNLANGIICNICGINSEQPHYVRINANGRILSGVFCKTCLSDTWIGVTSALKGDGVSKRKDTDESIS